MWRATAFPVRLFILDARTCLPMVLAIVHWSWTTLMIAVFSVSFFGVISFFGLTMPASLRVMRRWLGGSVRTAKPTWKRRRYS